jgi:hypothetical protein
MNHKSSLILLATACLAFGITSSARAVTTCTFTISGPTVHPTMTLNADCITDMSIIIPNNFTLDGAGHKITAVDPLLGHFTGGVLQNGGPTANVTNVTITASGLANICDAGAMRLRGILFDGASGSITGTTVLNLNQGVSGCQEGNGIEVRNFGASPTTIRVLIDGNIVTQYQKTGIVANGDTDATITDNIVTGAGPQPLIAQNGIQIGFGASGMVKRNEVSQNEYTGSSTSSGGILVVGGPFYDPTFSNFCVGVQIMQNTVAENDVGVWLSNLNMDQSAPSTATNNKVINNNISKAGVTNFGYQAGVSDVGNNDKIISNTITGAGYDPATIPGVTYSVDADPSFTNRAKVHANK